MFYSILFMTIGVLGALWRQYVARTSPLTVDQEIWVEWLSWIAIYIGCRVHFWTQRKPHYTPQDDQPLPHNRKLSENLKIYALSAVGVGAQMIKFFGISPSILPFVTSAVYLIRLIAERRCEEDLDVGELEELNEHQPEKPGKLSSRPRRVLFFLLGIISSLFLLRSTGTAFFPIIIASSFLFLPGRIATFTFFPRMSKIGDAEIPVVGMGIDWDLLEKISLPSFAYLTLVLALAVPGTLKPDVALFVCAAAEASWWFAVTSLSTNQLAIMATTVEGIAASFDLSIRSAQHSTAFLAAVPAMIMIWQAGSVSSSIHRHRHWLYLLMLVPLLGRVTYLDGISRSKYTISSFHPIEDIVLEAREHFSMLLSRQSTSLDQAMKEYHRRYGRDPPPYFDKWFELAQQHDFALVDEFDVMMQSLEPFWGVPPSTLQRFCEDVLAQNPQNLLKYEVRNHDVFTSQGNQASWIGYSMRSWLQDEWMTLLPNMSLAINVYDEPRVCIPRDALDSVMQLAVSRRARAPLVGEALETDNFSSPRFLNLAAQDAGEAITMSCPLQSPARSIQCDANAPDDVIPFIRNMTQGKDVCEHCELQSMEGFFFSPETLLLTHSLVPIWSQGKPSSFNDIIFPSPYYQVRSGDYQDAEDKDWDSKNDQLYWVGAATGGHATEGNWKKMQRQRLTLMTTNSSTDSIRLLKETPPGNWMAYTTNMSEISPLFSTRIMGITGQCEPDACTSQKTAFGVGDTEIKDTFSAAYDHKFLLDMDGNGFSGRFYRLLRSRSLVLKQAAFQEWHDDRIIPWVHFVPVSTSFVELPEMVRFFATTDKGKEISRQIADDSRVWAGKILRDIDLKLVWLRMLMEYGRIVDPARRV